VIITALVDDHRIRRVLLDGGSSSEIMYEHCFDQLVEEVQAKLVPDFGPLVGFAGESVYLRGQITLPVTLGTFPLERTVEMTFLVVKASSSHNIIIGRPGMCALGGVVSMIHATLKFPTPKGVGTVYADKQCAASETIPVSPDEKVELWAPNPNHSDQQVQIGEAVSEPFQGKLKKLLANNSDVFAWTPFDMAGVPHELSKHRLNVSKTMTLVAQKRRTMGLDQSKVVI
jgi:hypothetical protein